MPISSPSGVPVAGSGISVAASTVSLNTNNANGVGASNLLYTTVSTASGATVAGSSTQFLTVQAGGTLSVSGTSPSGTWRNISGYTIDGTVVVGGPMIRTV